MLYQLYEMQLAFFAPARRAADLTQHILRNPLNPVSYTHGGRWMAAACDLFEHTTRRYGKPKFGLRQTLIDGALVDVREEIVLRKTFGQLKYFRRAQERPNDPKLLLVAPMSGHYATLLRGTVAELLPDTHVYITDWRDARMVPLGHGKFGLDEYIDYLIEFLRFLGPNTHIMAVCQPSVPVLASVALLNKWGDPASPTSMILMGGPIDTRESPTKVNSFAKDHTLDWFRQHVIVPVPPPYPGMLRQVYPGFLQLAGFMSMNMGRHLNAHWQMFQHLVIGDGEGAQAKRAFYEEYRAVMDLDAQFYLETIEAVFHRHALPQGELYWRGQRVDPGAITRTALMTVEGELDDISGLGQTRAAHQITPNLPATMKLHYEQAKVGHYGIFNGSKWRREICPRVKAFMREQSRITSS
jgi:poly(3-hydroxybutyrate) depolymerase